MPLHEPAPAAEASPQSAETSRRNARYGLVLFAVYCALYGGFVVVNAFAPRVMETTIAGVNLAIWYGFGLIVAALVLALVYGWLCRDSVSAPSGGGRAR